MASAFANILQNSSGLNFNFVSSIFSQIVPFTLFAFNFVQFNVFIGTFGFLLGFCFPAGAAKPNPGGIGGPGGPGGPGIPGGGGGIGTPGGGGGIGTPGGGGGGGGGRGADILYLLFNHFIFFYIYSLLLLNYLIKI